MTAIHGLYLRRCDVCKRGMNDGYIVDVEYYCSDECLHKVYTPEQWTEMFADGEQDYCYWTEWDCYDGETELFTKDGTTLFISEEDK